jgi:hypothetical protein
MTLGMLGLAAWVVSTPAAAQAGPRPVAKERAAVVVEGVVREVFVSPRAGRVDVIAVLDVTRSELGPGWQAGARADVPAPGELAYVHVFMKEGQDSYRALPAERSQVRAYLVPGAAGGWEGTFPEWFEPTARELVARGANDPPPPADDAAAAGARRPAPAPSPAPAEGEVKPRVLGVVADPVSVGERVALKVTEVMPGSPAQAAGIESGDVILEANGAATTTPEQLAAAVRRSGNVLKLTVRNVRTGESVPVNVNLGPAGR